MSLKSKFKSLFISTCDYAKCKPKQATLIFLALLALFIFANIELLHYTTSPQFCKKCHPAETPGPLGEVFTWERSNHAKAGVQCIDCHAEPGFRGYMRAKLGGLGDVWSEYVKSPEHKMHVLRQAADPIYAAKLVKNDICLFCHNDAMNKKIRSERLMTIGIVFRKSDGVVNPEFRKKHGLPDILVEGVRPETAVDPNHKKHLGMGLNCVNCHGNITHNGIVGYRTNMQLCFNCHDPKRNEGKKPPLDANCAACHRNTDKIAPQTPILYKPAGADPVAFSHQKHLEKATCGNCHTALWPMKRGVKKMSMEQMYAGKLCGSCHDEKKAFGVVDCMKCHIEKKK